MERITHLWNVNQFVTRLNCPERINLQTHYIDKCIRFSRGIQLPPQKFGPSTMCPYCGSLWNTVDHSIRILPSRPVSKSVRKILNSMNNNGKRIPKVQKSLAKKSLKNETNKLSLKCSVCSNVTKIPFSKPQREKVTKSVVEITPQKKKKKRTKDRTAGLNISGISNLDAGNIGAEGSKETSAKRVGNTANFISSTQKLKKLNINRLKDIVNKGATPQKRKSLHSFLTEL